MKQRTQTDIFIEILKLLSRGEKRKTQIVYGCNLNFRSIQKYMEALKQAGFVVQSRLLEYSITPAGKIALERMEKAAAEMRTAMEGML